MRRQLWVRLFAVFVLATSNLLAVPARAQDQTADAFIKHLSSEMLNSIKTDPASRVGNVPAIIALVDAKLMPNVNFKRMTSSAAGPTWRQMTPEQQKRLQEEFKILLVRTYAGALSQIDDVTVAVKPLRAAPDDKELVVRTDVKGRGDPIQLDYRLEKTPGEGSSWKIYNLNIMGVWLVEAYRSQFAQEINAKGVDGLIAALADRNKSNAKKG
ncbi:ABC transporter substrate-binding protein [Rhodoferax ferrireducens]|uniref:MlaC/ttg2D family ABC transporter substrate-binding protein n=1 Tax=Rhodoferax ferrireducens TaxID=192843 RepID=UPI00298D9FD2|nr:ABC transporter substrate-binding protein [Rhodoferax ferrireducens]WPC67782.1 ABC transporter substrate-binding protein [Rhodoferax ferrireducens]